MTRPEMAFNPQPVKIFVIPALLPAHWMLAGSSSSNDFLTRGSEQIFIREIVPAFYPDPHLISPLLLWESGDKIFPRYAWLHLAL